MKGIFLPPWGKARRAAKVALSPALFCHSGRHRGDALCFPETCELW
jgi:hypothetical protein